MVNWFLSLPWCWRRLLVFEVLAVVSDDDVVVVRAVVTDDFVGILLKVLLMMLNLIPCSASKS